VILCDVDVLVDAFEPSSPRHDEYRSWLQDTLSSVEPYGVNEFVLSGFIRIVTHPRIFESPSSTTTALAFAHAVRSAANAAPILPGARHWSIFTDLLDETAASGNGVPDAYLAAPAIESGSEWITTDRGFARYPRLRWRHPLG
jgi:toxin-antitoxin system PIN domain toxin